ncbi:MAG TPA: LON peptidase substrate-binding domain-containing protein [Steroidobacteraceae bacterium]|nr:LON peptidase substrate-binding domain-containing protein [Steroidobacteraceae bacterium]
MPSSNQQAAVAGTTAEIALFPLTAVLYPGGPLPLRIFEPRYVDMVRRCMHEGRAFGVVLILSGVEAGGEVESTAEVGTSARIVDFYPLPDGLLGIYCLGEQKFRVLRRWRADDGLNIGAVRWLEQEPETELPGEYGHLGVLMQRLLPQLGELYDAVEKRPQDAVWIGYRLAEILPVAAQDKQQWLELEDPLARLAALDLLIRRDSAE